MPENSKPGRIVAIMGATATGKSALAIDLCERFGGEVVSMDSRQVYRGMDIGTGKVTPDELARIPHHLLDILDPREAGSAGAHVALAEKAVTEIHARGHVPFLVGGTGLYFRAYIDGLVDITIPPDELHRLREAMAPRATPELYEDLRRRDPERAGELSPNDRVRILRALELIEHTGRPVSELYAEQSKRHEPGTVLAIVLTMPRKILRRHIAGRTRALFDAGWGTEVARLLDEGVSVDTQGMRSLGYGAVAAAVKAGDDALSVIDAVITETRQYAKRQETFFRSVAGAEWVDVSVDGWRAGVEKRVGDFLSGPETA